MIPNHIPVINPLASLEPGGNLLRNWHRHMAFKVLASTSKGLRATFYKHSRRTRVVTDVEQPVMIRFFKEVTSRVHAFFVEYVIFFSHPKLSSFVLLW